MEFDSKVKDRVYDIVAKTGRVPAAAQLAAELKQPLDTVVEAFRRLAAKRLLVLEPGAETKIRMAPPFSGVETTFSVTVGDVRYYANCVWDALGVAAALQSDARIEASDSHTGEPISLEIQDGRPVPEPCVVHFAVPAAQWWQDIIHT